MFELIGGLRNLRGPGRAPIHVPWIRTALPIAYELGLEPWLALMPPYGYVPDFISPPPTTPLATFEEEIELSAPRPPSRSGWSWRSSPGAPGRRRRSSGCASTRDAR